MINTESRLPSAAPAEAGTLPQSGWDRMGGDADILHKWAMERLLETNKKETNNGNITLYGSFTEKKGELFEHIPN